MQFMTPKKKAVLDYIKSFESKNGYMPSLKELAKQFKVSVPTMWQHIQELSSMDFIDREPFKRRGIVLKQAQ